MQDFVQAGRRGPFICPNALPSYRQRRCSGSLKTCAGWGEDELSTHFTGLFGVHVLVADQYVYSPSRVILRQKAKFISDLGTLFKSWQHIHTVQ